MAKGTVHIQLSASGGNRVSREFGKAGKAIMGVSSVFQKVSREIMRGGIWAMGARAFSNVWGSFKNTIQEAFSSAFKFESTTTQFKTLIGNIDDAKAHMADLKALGDTPPFNLDQFAAASRQMMVLTDGVLGYRKSLELIGDAAAATGHPIEQMGHAVGKLYAFIRDGQPLSRAVMELRNMGVLTPEVAQKLQDMQRAGESSVKIWGEVEAALGRYAGAMKETEKTGNGLIAAIKTRWENIVREFGMAFAESAKGGMSDMLSKMEQLEESDAIGEWADSAVESLGKVAESAKGVASVLGSIGGSVWKGVKATLGTAWSFAAGMDEAGRNGEGWFNFSHGAAVAGEYWRREVNGESSEEEAAAEAEAKRERAERRAEMRRQRREEQERRAAEEKRRIEQALVEGQKKIEERRAEAEAVVAAKRAEEAAEIERDIQAEEDERAAREDLAEAYEFQAEQGKKKLAETAKKVKTLDATIDKLRKTLAEVEAGIAKTQMGQQADAEHTNGLFGPYQYGGRAHGGENFIDWGRAQRFAERGARDAEKAARRDRASQDRANRLNEDLANGKKLSPRDKKFLDDWNKYQEQRNNGDKARRALEQAEQERNKAISESRDLLKEIRDNINASLRLV